MDPSARPVVATTVYGPAGPAHLAATDRGIVALGLTTTADDFEAGLVRRLRRPVAWTDATACLPPRLREASAAIEAMLARPGPGAQARLDAIPIDLEDRPAWDREVLAAVRAIPRGEVRSYGDIARAIGRPGAARAVGGAVGRNPLAMLVPCHRVVAGDGTLGGYGGGWWGDQERNLELKAALLAGEGVSLPRSRPRSGRGR
jgi:O-6-methylguanine DNA methyltransferase